MKFSLLPIGFMGKCRYSPTSRDEDECGKFAKFRVEAYHDGEIFTGLVCQEHGESRHKYQEVLDSEKLTG